MLDEHGVEYRYREYRKDPLDESELRRLFEALDRSPADLLRTRDRAYRELELTGEEPADQLIALMAEHPTLLQRPIATDGGRAVVGRPVERLLEIL